MNIKDQILQAEDLNRHKEHVPEWDVDVWISELSAAGAEAYAMQLSSDRKDGKLKMDNFMCALLVCCLVDESGKRIFTDSDDVIRLAEKNGEVITRLYSIAEDMNGMNADDAEEQKKS